MMRVSDLDLLFFEVDDGAADEETAAVERTNALVVPPRPPSAEMLNTLEQSYRSQGLPSVVFIEDDDDGQPYLGNAVDLGKVMGLPSDVLPTEAQFDDWAARRRWASWEW